MSAPTSSRRGWLAAVSGTLLTSRWARGEEPASTVSESPRSSGPVAWVGADVHTGDGRVFAGGSLVVRAGRVLEVGPAGPLPAGVTRIDARGQVITPGWVATESALGLMEVELEPSTVDSNPGGAEPQRAVRAAYSVADAYNPRSTLLPLARRHGVCSAVATPSGGLISGTSAWFDLVDPSSGAEPLVRRDLALHVVGYDAAHGSRPRATSMFREALEAARLYARAPRASSDRTRGLGLSALDLRVLARVLSRELPVVVRAARASDIRALLRLSVEYRLRLVISGAEEAWLVAPEIAERGVGIIADPMHDLPESFGALGSSRKNVVLLQKAGVPVAFSTFDAHRAHNLRQLAGNAVAEGMSPADALQALCRVPAELFGLADRYGTLAPGRAASFSVWTGDPFQLDSWARQVVVRGESIALESRQQQLLERYRSLEAVPRGRAGWASDPNGASRPVR